MYFRSRASGLRMRIWSCSRLRGGIAVAMRSLRLSEVGFPEGIQLSGPPVVAARAGTEAGPYRAAFVGAALCGGPAGSGQPQQLADEPLRRQQADDDQEHIGDLDRLPARLVGVVGPGVLVDGDA